MVKQSYKFIHISKTYKTNNKKKVVLECGIFYYCLILFYITLQDVNGFRKHIE